MSYQIQQPSLPGKVQAIAIMQTVLGAVEIIASLIGLLYVLLVGLITLGIGLIALPIPLIFMLVGILSLISGIKGLKRTSTYGFSLGVAICQMCLLLSCDVLSFGAGLACVILLTQPEVKAYFGRS